MATRKVSIRGTSGDAGATVTLTGDATTSYIVPNGTAAAPSLAFVGSTGAGVFQSASNVIGLATAGTERWDVSASGHLEPYVAATYSVGATNRCLSVGTQGVVNGRGSSGSWEESSWTEELTLNTGGATTDSTANLPADSEILGVVARVTQTITTATDWAVGDPATAARFLTATTDLTAGTTKVCLNHRQGSVATDATGPVQATAAKLRITTSGSNPGAGKVRVTVFYRTFTAPSA